MPLVSGYESSSSSEEEDKTEKEEPDAAASAIPEPSNGRNFAATKKRSRRAFVQLPSLLPKPNFDDLSDDSDDDVNNNTTQGKKSDAIAPSSASTKSNKLNMFLRSLPRPSVELRTKRIHNLERAEADMPLPENSISTQKKKETVREMKIAARKPRNEPHTDLFGTSCSASRVAVGTKPSTITHSVSSAPVLAASSTSVDDDALPNGWKSALDASSGQVYYYHVTTNQTTWSRPTHSYPSNKIHKIHVNTTRSKETSVSGTYSQHVRRRDIGMDADVVDIDMRQIHDASAWAPPSADNDETASKRRKITVNARHWDHASGTSTTTDEPSQLQKRKHQLNSLVHHAQQNINEILAKSRIRMKSKSKARSRYGW